MKQKLRNSFLVLSSLLLLIGCVNQAATKVKLVRLNADDVDSFNITTNLEEVKEIHTEQQKEYLSYSGDYVSIPEANYPDGQKHLSDPNPVNLAWDFSAPSGKTVSRYDVVVDFVLGGGGEDWALELLVLAETVGKLVAADDAGAACVVRPGGGLGHAGDVAAHDELQRELLAFGDDHDVGIGR